MCCEVVYNKHNKAGWWHFISNVEAYAMLISSFRHSVDAKGRIFIPAKWREDLGDTVIVTRGLMGKGGGRCLSVMSMPVWNEVLERFKKTAMSDVTAQNAMRMLFANACDCELDKQGRILISSQLRALAQLDEEVVLIGMGNRVELWSAPVWERHCQEDDGFDDDTLAYLTGLGI